jgi:hypothetical protein
VVVEWEETSEDTIEIALHRTGTAIELMRVRRTMTIVELEVEIARWTETDEAIEITKCPRPLKDRTVIPGRKGGRQVCAAHGAKGSHSWTSPLYPGKREEEWKIESEAASKRSTSCC